MIHWCSRLYYTSNIHSYLLLSQNLKVPLSPHSCYSPALLFPFVQCLTLGASRNLALPPPKANHFFRYQRIMPQSVQRSLQPILAKDSLSSSSRPLSTLTDAQSSTVSVPVKPSRPCDLCRRRKSRCVIPNPEAQSCTICIHHNQPCTFVEDPAPRKRKAPGAGSADMPSRSSKRSYAWDFVLFSLGLSSANT